MKTATHIVAIGLAIVLLFCVPAGAVEPYLVKDIVAGAVGSEPGALSASSYRLFFAAHDPEHGRELWQSDGTASGTTLVKDIYPGPGGKRPICADAADANDDGVVDISDPIFTLGYLFLGAQVFPEPFPGCGLDPGTSDQLECEAALIGDVCAR